MNVFIILGPGVKMADLLPLKVAPSLPSAHLVPE